MTPLRTMPPLLAALAVAGGLAACGSGEDTDTAAPVPAPGPGSGDTIYIKTFIFRPDPVEVKAGTTITWRNLDDILHTVTSGRRVERDGTFDERLLEGDVFRHTYDRPGTYRYFCSVHLGEGMEGAVVVK